jgi:hypothetical protein
LSFRRLHVYVEMQTFVNPHDLEPERGVR